MIARLNYVWRVGATGVCFASFGLGSLFLALAIAPMISLFPAHKLWKRDTIHFVIHVSSCLFVRMLRFCGILTISVKGGEKLRKKQGYLVVANHPSLLDVVFLNALLTRTSCIVKQAVWYNPVMKGVARAAGYISNRDPENVVAECAAVVSSGRSLIMFPEGTRTTPGKRMTFRRGAANMALRARKNITPVAITVRPSTLTRDNSWYDVPPAGPFHVTLAVGDEIEVEPFNHGKRWIAAQRLTAVLQDYFQQAVMANG